jgi:hypothetical protein
MLSTKNGVKNLSGFRGTGIRCQQHPKDCRVGLVMGPGWTARQKDQTGLPSTEVHILRRVLRLCGTCCSLVLTTSDARFITNFPHLQCWRLWKDQ